MTTVPHSGPDTSVPDFVSQLKAAKTLRQDHERAFVLVNIAAAPGDVAVAIKSEKIHDAQTPIFGSLPIRTSRYFDKNSTDYKRRILSNCKKT